MNIFNRALVSGMRKMQSEKMLNCLSLAVAVYLSLYSGCSLAQASSVPESIPSSEYNYNSVCGFIDERTVEVKRNLISKAPHTSTRLSEYRNEGTYVKYIQKQQDAIIVEIRYDSSASKIFLGSKINMMKMFSVSKGEEKNDDISMACDASTLTINTRGDALVSISIQANFID